MRTKRAIYNTLASTSMQLITFVIGFILPKFIIESYGSTTYGLITSITQFVVLLFFIEMGLRGSLVYELYKPVAEKNILEINKIMSTAKNSYNKVGLYFCLLLIILIVIYPKIIETNDINYLETLVLIISIGATGLINYFTTAKYTVLLTASQREYVYSLSRIVYLITNISIIAILVNYDLSISNIYFVSLISNLLQVLIIVIYSRRLFPFLSFKFASNNKYLSKRNDVLVHRISQSILTSSPVIILTLFATLEDVSIYAIYAIIFGGINTITSVLSNSLSSSFGQLISQNQVRILKKSYSQFELLFYMVIAFVFSGALILGISFVEIYSINFADGEYIDFQLLILFTIVGVLDNFRIPQNTIVIAAGHYKETRYIVIIQSIITILVSIILVLYMGIKGVLIGSIIGLLYRSIELFYIKKIIDISVYNTFIRIVRVIVTIIISIIPFYLIIPINSNSIYSWLLDGILVSIWICSVIFIINYIFEKECLKGLIKKLTTVLIKKNK